MNRKISDDELAEFVEEIGYVSHMRNIPRTKKNGKSSPARRPVEPAPIPIIPAIPAETDEEEFRMTYRASRHEAIWLEESLANFFHQKWFDDVLRMVKGGKEASVYLCRGNASSGYDYLAAKVYRPRRFRSLKNDWMYREGRRNLDESGREIHNKGMVHAMEKRTEYGRELLHTSWLEHEFQALTALYEAGADVPRPFASDANAILMEYYGDDVMGAPTLNEVDLPAVEARSLFDRVLHNIELMLQQGRIHGDLSAYNILYWEGEIVLIDFPQVIRPEENRSAYLIFERDVKRVCEYFQRKGVRSNPRQLSTDLWRQYRLNFIPQVDPKALDEDREDEREIWESLKNA